MTDPLARVAPAAQASLCGACAHARRVTGRHGQGYVLCRCAEIAAKYPRQPVAACPCFAVGVDEP